MVCGYERGTSPHVPDRRAKAGVNPKQVGGVVQAPLRLRERVFRRVLLGERADGQAHVWVLRGITWRFQRKCPVN
ncbi:unnamed protein product [Scytosiphon promiscuus]